MRCRELAIFVASLVGCGAEPEPARRIDHRAIYAADHALYDLSIARSEAGATVIAWTAGELGNGGPAWLELGSDEVHRASFPESQFGPAARVWSRLVPTQNGFARFVGQFTWTSTPLYELGLLEDASLESFTALSRIFAPSTTTLEAVAFEGRALVVALNSQWRLVVHEVEPEDRLVGVVGSMCDFGVRAVRVDERVIVLTFDCGMEEAGLRQPVAALVELNPGPVPIQLLDTDPTPDDLVAVGAAASTVGTLWLSPEGKLRFFVHQAISDRLELTDPVLEVDRAQSARLFATEKRFAITYRIAEGASVPSETSAVTVDPMSLEVSEPFEWPLGEDDCPITAYLPTGAGLEYACVGRCQGAGCAQRWLYHGTVELY